MVRWPKFLGLALLPGGLLLLGAVPAPHAATSSTVDILSNDAAADARDTVDIGGVKPLANRGDGASRCRAATRSGRCRSRR